jgi:hypothetical protein
MIKLLKMTLVEGKSSVRIKPGYCNVFISKEKQKLLEPALQGPFRVFNEIGVPSADNVALYHVASMPFSLLRVSTQSVDLQVSFDPPSFKFKKDVNVVSNDCDSLQLMHLNSYTLPDACKANHTKSRVTLTPTEDNTYSLNVRQQTIGSQLYKLDLSSLDSLREALARQN